MDTMTKRLVERGRSEQRPNKSGSPHGRDRKGVLRRSELSELFADLDQAVYSMYLESEVYVTAAGYAVTAHPGAGLTDGTDEEWFQYFLEQSTSMVQGIVSEMTVRLGLPDEWPAQFSRLFPKAYWDGVDVNSPFGLRMSGSAVRVSPEGPSVVLHKQLYYSRAEPLLPTTLGQVARAAGLRSVKSVKAEYDAAYPDDPLRDQRWNEVESALFDADLS